MDELQQLIDPMKESEYLAVDTFIETLTIVRQRISVVGAGGHGWRGYLDTSLTFKEWNSSFAIGHNMACCLQMDFSGPCSSLVTL